jgi:hypothetical protein
MVSRLSIPTMLSPASAQGVGVDGAAHELGQEIGRLLVDEENKAQRPSESLPREGPSQRQNARRAGAVVVGAGAIEDGIVMGADDENLMGPRRSRKLHLEVPAGDAGVLAIDAALFDRRGGGHLYRRAKVGLELLNLRLQTRFPQLGQQEVLRLAERLQEQRVARADLAGEGLDIAPKLATEGRLAVGERLQRAAIAAARHLDGKSRKRGGSPYLPKMGRAPLGTPEREQIPAMRGDALSLPTTNDQRPP